MCNGRYVHKLNLFGGGERGSIYLSDHLLLTLDHKAISAKRYRDGAVASKSLDEGLGLTRLRRADNSVGGSSK